MKSEAALFAEIAVVTYHSHVSAARELLALVDRAKENEDLRLTFVDNSEDSSDSGFLAPLVGHIPNIRILTRPENPGFAAGCNLVGLRSKAEWVVFINPDVLLEAEAWEGIVRGLRGATDGTGAVAISQQTGKLRHLGVACNWAGWFMDRPITSLGSDGRGVREVLYRAVGGAGALVGPSGGAAAYRTSVFQQYGGYESDLFAWGEDADLALRLHLGGIRCLPLDLRLPHQGGHSVATGEVASRRAYLLVRNRVLVAARLYSWPQVVLFTGFLLGVLAIKLPLMLRDRTLVANVRGLARGYGTFCVVRHSYKGARLRLLASNR